MSVNIKQADGLKRLSQTIEFYKSSSSISIPQLFTGSYNDLTDKPIIDGNAIIESIETTQSSFYVQDGSGNTIALIDDQGVHSIDFYANGESVKQHMSSSTSQLNDLSGALALHKNNHDIHITSEEREQWNDPLSGEGDTLYINDAFGNTIAIFDANGLTTTKVTIKFDGKSLEISSKLAEVDNSLTSIQNKNNDQDGRLDELETATEKLDFIDASELDTTLSIVDTNGNPIAQFDASGLTTTEVTIADSKGSPIQVGAKIENVEGRVSTAEGEIDTLQGQLQILGNNASALEGRVSTAEGEIDTLQSQTSTLIASDSGKSVRTIANEELAAALITEDAQESLDTLQEIANWIQDHPEDAAAMNSKIEANTTAINNHINDAEPRIESLEEKTANIEDSAEADAFTVYDKNNQPGFQVDANGTTAHTLNANTITSESINGTHVSAGEISTDLLAVGDINSVEQAINSLDQNITNLGNDLRPHSHTHNNKSLLDTYDQTNANIKDAVTKKHEHSNKIVLDETTASFTTEHETKLGGLPTGAELTASLNNKQDTLTPGSYIDITNNVIGVKDLPYSALKDIPNTIVHDANYTHTDNNFTAAYKGQLDGISTTYATKDELTDYQNNAESTYRKISDSYTKGEVDAKIPTDFYTTSQADAKFAFAPEEGDYALYKEGTWQEEPAIAVIAAGGVGSNNNDTRISDLVLKNDIVNDLTSDLTNVPLSAAQGKALKAAIDSIGDIAAGAGNGDMLKTVYDTNNNGKVDHAEYADTANTADNASKLGGKEASDYALASRLNDYRTISDSYSKTEVDDLIKNLPSDDTDTTYTFTNSGSSLIITPSEGEVKTLDLSTDLSNYYTKSQTETWVNNQGYTTIRDVEEEVYTQLGQELGNYYTKTQVYSKDEVNNLIAGLEGGDIEIPTANSFVNIVAGMGTITANSSTDTLTFAAGNNINISSNTTDKKITIEAFVDGGKQLEDLTEYRLILGHPRYQEYSELYHSRDITANNYGDLHANAFITEGYGLTTNGIDPSSDNNEHVFGYNWTYTQNDITSEGAWVANSSLNVTNEIYENNQRVASRTWVGSQLNNYILLQDMYFVSYHQNVNSPINYSFGGEEIGQATSMQLVYALGSDDNSGFFYMPSDRIDEDQHPDPSYQIANIHTIASALTQYVSKTSIGYHTDSNQNIEFSIGSNTASPNKSLVYRLNADGEGSFYYEPNEEISQELNEDAEIATIGDVNVVKGQLEEYIKVFTIDYPGGLDLFYQNNYTLTGSLPNNMTAANLIEQGYNIICFVDGDLRIQFTMSQMSDEGMMMGYAPVPNLVRALSPQYISADIVVADSGYTIMLSKGQSIQLDLTLGDGYVTNVETLNIVRNLYRTYGLVSLRINNAVTFVPTVCFDYGTQGLLGFITDFDIVQYQWDYNAGGNTQITPTIKRITTENSLTTTLGSYATKTELNNYAPVSSLNNYLAVSGGTMTGPLGFGSASSVRNSNNDTFVIETELPYGIMIDAKDSEVSVTGNCMSLEVDEAINISSETINITSDAANIDAAEINLESTNSVFVYAQAEAHIQSESNMYITTDSLVTLESGGEIDIHTTNGDSIYINNTANTISLTNDGVYVDDNGAKTTYQDEQGKVVAQIDKNGLTVTKINVVSNTDNFVKTFRFGDHIQELDNNKQIIRWIYTDVPNQNDWGALYEYFRQDVFQMTESIGPDSCVGYFVKAYQNAMLPTNLKHYLCAMVDIANLDSFKVEMLGSYGSASECTMIITLLTRTAETYKLQICSQHDLIDGYISSGWYKEGITSSKLLDLSSIITNAHSDTTVDLSNNTSLVEKIKNVDTIIIGQTQKVWCRMASATYDPLMYFVGSYFGDTFTEHRCVIRLTPDNSLEYRNI